MKRILFALISLSLLLPTISYGAPALPIAGNAAALNAPDQNKIGIVAAVKGTVKVGSSNQVGRVVSSGEPIFLGDVVSTDSESTLQILLMDQTVFTIGPNSSIVIDKFVFDPATQSGKVNAKVVKGVFRFVTGQIAHKRPSDMSVDLPSGTIGVRGTIVAGETDGKRSTVVLLGPGANNNTPHRIGRIVVSNEVNGKRKEVTITRPGFGTVIENINIAPKSPFEIPSVDLQRITNALEPPRPQAQKALPGQAGGLELQNQSATQAAGQDHADRRPAREANANGEFTGGFDREREKAAQNAVTGEQVADGLARFRDLRKLTLGKFDYKQTGALRNNAGGIVGNYDAHYIIDFGARQAGGPGSNISGTISAQSYSMALPPRPFGPDEAGAIFSYPLQPIAGCGGNCQGAANIGINNRGGNIADNAHFDIRIVNNNTSADGRASDESLPRQSV